MDPTRDDKTVTNGAPKFCGWPPDSARIQGMDRSEVGDVIRDTEFWGVLDVDPTRDDETVTNGAPGFVVRDTEFWGGVGRGPHP